MDAQTVVCYYRVCLLKIYKANYEIIVGSKRLPGKLASIFEYENTENVIVLIN